VTNTSSGVGYRNAAADPSKVEDAPARTTAGDEAALARDDYEREWDGDTLQDAVVAAERRRKAARRDDEQAFEEAYKGRKDDDE
jgi:hypothetical protein